MFELIQAIYQIIYAHKNCLEVKLCYQSSRAWSGFPHADQLFGCRVGTIFLV